MMFTLRDGNLELEMVFGFAFFIQVQALCIKSKIGSVIYHVDIEGKGVTWRLMVNDTHLNFNVLLLLLYRILLHMYYKALSCKHRWSASYGASSEL